MSTASRPLRVVAQRAIAGELRLLSLERDAPFRAGQLLGLSLPPRTGETPIPPRLYSIASGENDPHWDILYTVEESGSLTPRLERLRPADTLLVTGPSGDFAAGSADASDGATWIGGGTGIAPFAALARSGRAPAGLILHAASLPELFYGSELFESLPDTIYARCCPRAEPGDPRFFRGRATDWIEAAADLPRERPWLLAGGSEFVVAVRDALIARGIPYSRILSEVYF